MTSCHAKAEGTKLVLVYRLKGCLVVSAVVVLAASCAAPTPTLTPAPAVISTPASTAPPIPTATPRITVDVGERSARCDGVGATECRRVAALFVNTLAWSGDSVFEQSGGNVTVKSRPECPILPHWADPSTCWQATAVVPDRAVCMVVGRRTDVSPPAYGQVGGDDLTGRAGGPPKGWPTAGSSCAPW
jgi:hypothetical protein